MRNTYVEYRVLLFTVSKKISSTTGGADGLQIPLYDDKQLAFQSVLYTY